MFEYCRSQHFQTITVIAAWEFRVPAIRFT